MENSIVILIITVVFIACMFLAWYFSHKAKHAERMSMLEKGMYPDAKSKKVKNKGFLLLKTGIVVIGLSIGLGLNGILISQHVISNSNAIPFAILGLCGGISLVIANFINQPKDDHC